MRSHSFAFALSLVLCACGGDVEKEGKGDSAGTGGGGGGSGGSGGMPASCPSGPLDREVQALVGKPCATNDELSASNNGCGGCTVRCVDGVWASDGKELCYSIGAAC